MTYEEQLADIHDDLKPIVTAWLLGATVYRYEVDPKSEQLMRTPPNVMFNYRVLSPESIKAMCLAVRFKKNEKMYLHQKVLRDVDFCYSLKDNLLWTSETQAY